MLKREGDLELIRRFSSVHCLHSEQACTCWSVDLVKSYIALSAAGYINKAKKGNRISFSLFLKMLIYESSRLITADERSYSLFLLLIRSQIVFGTLISALDHRNTCIYALSLEQLWYVVLILKNLTLHRHYIKRQVLQKWRPRWDSIDRATNSHTGRNSEHFKIRSFVESGSVRHSIGCV